MFSCVAPGVDETPYPDERAATLVARLARSKAAAGRGEFATDEQVQAVWAKHDP